MPSNVLTQMPDAPLLIRAYLAKHSHAEASAHGIGVPAKIAAK
jgi:hypothetical protein